MRRKPAESLTDAALLAFSMMLPRGGDGRGADQRSADIMALDLAASGARVKGCSGNRVAESEAQPACWRVATRAKLLCRSTDILDDRRIDAMTTVNFAGERP